MPDYSSGKIYMVYPKVEDPDEGDVYYGSTTDTLARRMTQHRHQTQCKILFDKYGIKNCFIELVEAYPCETREQLNKKEGEYIRANKCINKRIAGRTREEWLGKNKDKLLEYQKEYKIDNIDKYLEYQKEYRTVNRDKLKELYIKTKDKRLEYQKHYRNENKDKITERKKQKANCPHCNKEITKAYMKTHIKLGRCRSLPQSVHTTDPESN